MGVETESPLVAYARDELQRAGLFDADSDYDGMLGPAVMELVECIAGKGHSGGSHALVMQLFQLVGNYKPLTPLTSDPSEWIDRTEMSGRPLWQSTRDPSVFSEDGGKTWAAVN